MPELSLTGQADAPVQEVCKLLFDPTRFPEWWTGAESVRSDDSGNYTQWPTGYPDFPMPQKIRSDHSNGQVTISGQVSDIDITWQLAEYGPGKTITVHMRLPKAQAHRLDTQHEVLASSLTRLAALAVHNGERQATS
jgi:uncharacterized protein YndB with AHSA1/START domain